MNTKLLALTFTFSLAAAVAMAGCSSSDSTTPAPADQDSGTDTSTGGAAGSAADAAPDSEASVGQDVVLSDSPTALTVKVTYLGTSVDVDVTQPTAVQDGGDAYSLVSDVITIAIPSKAITTLQAGFVGSDGYNPATKGSCSNFVPVDGANLSKGWIDRTTRDLSWDDSLGLPGCMNVKNLAEILVTDK
jgi:hypothetical protein